MVGRVPPENAEHESSKSVLADAEHESFKTALMIASLLCWFVFGGFFLGLGRALPPNTRIDLLEMFAMTGFVMVYSLPFAIGVYFGTYLIGRPIWLTGRMYCLRLGLNSFASALFLTPLIALVALVCLHVLLRLADGQSPFISAKEWGWVSTMYVSFYVIAAGAAVVSVFLIYGPRIRKPWR